MVNQRHRISDTIKQQIEHITDEYQAKLSKLAYGAKITVAPFSYWTLKNNTRYNNYSIKNND